MPYPSHAAPAGCLQDTDSIVASLATVIGVVLHVVFIAFCERQRAAVCAWAHGLALRLARVTVC